MVWPLELIFRPLTMKISCYFIAFLTISWGFRLVLAVILADLTTEIHENTNEINQNNMISSSLVAEKSIPEARPFRVSQGPIWQCPHRKLWSGDLAPARAIVITILRLGLVAREWRNDVFWTVVIGECFTRSPQTGGANTKQCRKGHWWGRLWHGRSCIQMLGCYDWASTFDDRSIQFHISFPECSRPQPAEFHGIPTRRFDFQTVGPQTLSLLHSGSRTNSSR